MTNKSPWAQLFQVVAGPLAGKAAETLASLQTPEGRRAVGETVQTVAGIVTRSAGEIKDTVEMAVLQARLEALKNKGKKDDQPTPGA